MHNVRLTEKLIAKEVAAMERILIATDGSPNGSEAVKQGLALAAGLRARVTFAYVRKRPHEIVGDAYYQRALTAALARGRQVIEEALVAARKMDVDAEGEIMEGDAPEQIVNLSRSRHADMIVVGSRGLGAVAGTLLGSVSRAVVANADRPVLVITSRAVERRAAA